MALLQRKIDARSIESFLPEPVDFVGQQVGPGEDELKADFLRVLAAKPTVQSAYLARIFRGNAPKPAVALCLRSSIGVDYKLEEELAGIFRERFRHDQRLDFLFLLEQEEMRLREVCPSFYDRHA